MTFELIMDDGRPTIVGDGYRLHVDLRRPRAELTDSDDRPWSMLSLLADAHPADGRDESRPTGGPTVEQAAPDRISVVQELRSNVWASATTRLDCRPDRLELTFAVTTPTPRGLGRVTLLGGSGRLPTGASGTFRSGLGFRSLFVPTPTEPVAVTRPAEVPASVGVVGDAEPGRLHGVFSPGPYAFGFGRAAITEATNAPGGDWLGCWLRAAVQDCAFASWQYEPLDGGFLLSCDHLGHTTVTDTWSTTLVLRPATGAWTMLADYRDDLLAHGLAPAPTQPDPPAWWSQPMFCGWGAQCARAAANARDGDGADLVGGAGATAAPALCRQDLYDDWLSRLAEHDLVPGTIVLDDRWQARYGDAEPDPDHWPDLRTWIAERHRQGQRVLLWWKAWDADGLPADICCADADDTPVAVDPGSEGYRRHIAQTMQRLLGPDGLDADGFKIDFTQRTPVGADLTGVGPWGTAGLHALLELLYTQAKRVKSDALMITHTVHPGFADVTDMIRLNDILERDPGGRRVPVVDQMRFRHRVAAAVLPEHPVDTDQWPMPDRDQWLSYVAVQPELGVPALYYCESIDGGSGQITDTDLAAVHEAWHRAVGRAR